MVEEALLELPSQLRLSARLRSNHQQHVYLRVHMLSQLPYVMRPLTPALLRIEPELEFLLHRVLSALLALLRALRLVGWRVARPFGQLA